MHCLSISSYSCLRNNIILFFRMQLQKKYPYMKLKVVAHAVKPPTVNVKPHGANLTLPGNVDIYVTDTATNSTPLAFTIGVVGAIILCHRDSSCFRWYIIRM